MSSEQQQDRVWHDWMLPMAISVTVLAILFIFAFNTKLNGPVRPGPNYDPIWIAWLPDWAVLPLVAVFGIGVLAGAAHNFYHWHASD